MRYNYYRSFCDYSPSYDLTIDWIKNNNPHNVGLPEEKKEEFACRVVNDCIRSVLFGDHGNWCSTGMAFAARVSNNPDSPSYMKVVLCIKL